MRLIMGTMLAFITCSQFTWGAGPGEDWRHYGGSLAGAHFSALTQINRDNVSKLSIAWVARTGDLPDSGSDTTNLSAFQATPIKVGSSLYLCSPRNIVIAIDSTTGQERWRFDPHTDTTGHYVVTCRGVAYHEQRGISEHCSARVVAATLDGRLFSVDAQTGTLCPGFGDGGMVSLTTGLGYIAPGFYSITSPPLVIGDTIVVGSLVLDNQDTDVPSGVVRGFNVISGKLQWAWDAGSKDNPVPPDRDYYRGSPNAWSLFSADLDLGLVFIPTGNSSPDYFGGERTLAEELHSSSVVAIAAATGKTRWVFQTVHHDLWDYDVSSQPVLVDLPHEGELVPALVQATKQGQLFVLDRRTGDPLYRIEELPVPGGPAMEDWASRTQPFSTELPALHPLRLTIDDMWGLTPLDRAWCTREFEKYRHEGLFTPPSLQGSVNYPSNLGASNWGSVAIDPKSHVLIANTNRLASIAKLIPREEADQLEADGVKLLHPSRGTPYAVDTHPFLSPLGIPCTKPPWGLLTAIDLIGRKKLWEVPFGTIRDLAPLPIPWELGVPNTGGPLLTASGLIFIGAAADDYFRVYDAGTGEELLKIRLPAGGQATPMTYLGTDGRQYVVLCAGGHAHLGTKPGDFVIAFALQD